VIRREGARNSRHKEKERDKHVRNITKREEKL